MMDSTDDTGQQRPATEPEPFVDATEAGKFLQLRPRRVLELARLGVLPAYHLGEGVRWVWRFRLRTGYCDALPCGTLCSAVSRAKTGDELKWCGFNVEAWRVEPRKSGTTWVLRYFVTRPSDSRRVEHKLAVGLVRDFPSESAAWAEVEKQHLQTQINKSDFRGRVTFADLAQHYIRHELDEQAQAIAPKSHTTIAGYKRILRGRCLDRFARAGAASSVAG